MVNLLGRSVNKPVLLSIRSVVQDSVSFVCTLVGIETGGVWVEGEAALDALGVKANVDRRTNVFIPFAQIVFLMEAPVETQAKVRVSGRGTQIATHAPARESRG